MHSELLAAASNKYQLVLDVARRAKFIKEDIQNTGMVEANKPIPLAITEMVREHGEQAELQS
jgi:DNA-directed RNA polymerase subunit K/omega